MSPVLLIIVLFLGILLLTLEIVALPGGIAGVFGVIMIVLGVWQTYIMYGNSTGTIVLLCSIALIVLMIIIMLKKKTWSRFSLNDEVDSKVNQESNSLQIGMHGRTISRLAPTGKALIEGETYEVHAVNKFIEQDKDIEVVAIEGYRIDVCEPDDNRFDEAK